MKMKNALPTIIIILTILIIGIFVCFDRFIAPNKKTEASYLLVLQEYDCNEILSLSIQTSNQSVVVKKSTDDKIRVTYYQKIDHLNEYHLENKEYFLVIFEKAEDLNNVLFKANKQIDIVTIYLPEDTKCTINVTSVEGGLRVTGINATNVLYVTGNGQLTIENCQTSFIEAHINTGNVSIDKTYFDYLKIDAISGSTTINIEDSILDYNIDLETKFGYISLNDEKMFEVDPVTDKVRIMANYQYQNEDTNRYIVVNATRASIDIRSNEPIIEPEPAEETVETPEA